MNVLLTNDDGIYSKGLISLAKMISKIAKIYIVAPDRERSAISHAITMHKPLRAKKVTIPEMPKHSIEQCWKVNGTPSDCVKLAIEALLKNKPDLVLSGINKGANLGTDIMYSGTVSAAIEAAIAGIPAIALSINSYNILNYDYPIKFVKKLCKKMRENYLPDIILNINIPYLAKHKIKGVYITYLGQRKYKNVFVKRKDPRGKVYYWLAGDVVETTEDVGSDIWAVRNGYISITPLHFDLTKYSVIEDIRKWGLTP